MNFKHFLTLSTCLAAVAVAEPSKSSVQPLAIGSVLTLRSTALGESRRITVWRPPRSEAIALPVIYLLDGGLEEDFLHVAGLAQVGASNGTMRPFMVVGIENTQRRRDLTGPTSNVDDKKIAPVVGGSAAFRKFLFDELIPEIERRFRCTSERALVGESLAGLFVIETVLTQPDRFSSYLAVDPSLWWNDGWLVEHAATLLDEHPVTATVSIAHSNEPKLAELAKKLSAIFTAKKIAATVTAFPKETHATVLHPALLELFRARFAP